MLIFNKSLQKAKISTYTQFNRVKYLQSVISKFVTKNESSIKILIMNYSNMLIRATKSIDEEVIEIKALEW